ncbi:hypothetical protein M3J07_003116 [Ascochyta lentis]
MLRSTVGISAALVGIAALASFYALQILSQTSLPSGLQVSSSPTIPDELALSLSTLVINPDHHSTVNDTRSVTVSVPTKLSHEQILARYLVGFFGGYVFAPERRALKLMGKRLVKFKELSHVPESTHLWATAELDDGKLPPVHSVLFGAFRIVDIQVPNSAESSPLHSGPLYSYIDFAFGADEYFIAGVHRFFVSELGGAECSQGTRCITVGFAHTGCNPRENKPLGPAILQTLHLWYAMLLFKEGVVEILKMK